MNVLRSRFLLLILSAFVLLNISCFDFSYGINDDYGINDEKTDLTSSVKISINSGETKTRALSAVGTFDQVAKVTVNVIGDNEIVIGSVDLALDTDGVWSGTIEGLPAGVALNFRGIAYDGSNPPVELFSGTTTKVLEEVSDTLSISLAPVSSGVAVTFPTIRSITSPSEINSLSTESIDVAVEGSPNEILTYQVSDTENGSFTPSSGSITLSSSGTGNIILSYSAPIQADTYKYSFTVTNSLNASVKTNFELKVVGSVSNLNVSVLFAPVLTGIEAERTGSDVTWTATVSDDGPLSEISYLWSFIPNTVVNTASFSVSNVNPGILSGYDDSTGGTIILTLTDGAELSTTISFDLEPGQFPDDVLHLSEGLSIQTGSAGSESGNDVVVDADGNIYIVGATTGDLSGDNHGDRDIFLMKYKSNGVKEWTKQVGTANSDSGNGIALDSDGNVYITGLTGGDLSGDNHGTDDIFLIKYDTDGAEKLRIQTGTAGIDFGKDIAIDPAGNIYIAGGANVNPEDTFTSDTDAYVIKYNSDGEKEWDRAITSPLIDSVNGISVDSAENVYIIMTTIGDPFGLEDGGFSKTYVLKYNTNENGDDDDWWREIPSSQSLNNEGMSIALGPGGEVYIAGYLDGALDDYDNLGGFDIFLVKYDSDGDLEWAVQTGSSSNDFCNKVSVDSDGNAYITGKTYGSLDGNVNAGRYDIFLMKYDKGGMKQWTRQLGTSYDDAGNSVSLDSAGNAYVTGSTSGGLDEHENQGENDIFLIKYNPDGIRK